MAVPDLVDTSSLPPERPPAAVARDAWVGGALWAYAIVGLGAFAFVAAQLWQDPGCDLPGGTWAALASDLLHGRLYRPLVSELGYGGSRYMPGFIALYAGAVAVIGDPIRAGLLLSLASVLALAAAVAVTCAELDVVRWARLPLALTVLSTGVCRALFYGARCDYVSATLALLCLVGTLRGQQNPDGRGFALATGFAVAAGFVKITDACVVIVPFAVLVRNGQPGRALCLAGGASLVGVVGLALVQGLSGGHFVESFVTTANANSPWERYLLSPLYLYQSVTQHDPTLLTPLAVATIGWLLGGPSSLRLFSITVLVVTTLVQGSRGTGPNHDVLLHAACLCQMGVMLGRSDLRRVVGAGCVAALLAVLLSVTMGPDADVAVLARPRLSARTASRIIARLPAARPWFSQNAIVPLLAGARPFVLDEFNLRYLALRDGPVRADFERRVHARDFSAVVLRTPPDLAFDVEDATDPRLAGLEDPFWDATEDAFRAFRGPYKLVAIIRPYAVLLPSSVASPR